MAITYRQGSLEDNPAAFDVFLPSLEDLGRRSGFMAITGGDNPEVMANLRALRSPMFEHIQRTVDQFWLAEDDGRAIGYARSILRDGLQELCELFVLPGCQASGVGHELIRRALPDIGAKDRVIIATSDARALVLYMKAGVYARFPTVTFSRRPRDRAYSAGLEIRLLLDRPQDLAAIAHIDRQVIGHAHDVDHRWLLAQRQGYLYTHNGVLLGYGYVGIGDCGPFALLDPAWYPDVLSHAESMVARLKPGEADEVYFEIPMINRHAVDYLLGEGYQMSSFLALFMSNVPFGNFEQYIFPSPPFFL